MTVHNVTAGQSLQSAIDSSLSGDVINVEAGASFVGPFELSAKSGSADITIQSSRVSDLPQSRVDASHSPLMPKIVCPNFEQAIRTKPGAHHYKFDGIEVLPTANSTEIYDLVRFGGSRHDQQTLSAVPHHLKMDRCYIHGLPAITFLQRGLSLNSSDTEVTRSYFSEIHARGMDTQAICSWNTPGRNEIIDCYLEAAGENLMLGGADPFSVEFIPSDYQVLRCQMFKPLTWKGQGWVIKNLLEIKTGQRIQIDGCALENNWGGEGQSGIAILFTTRNQEGTAPYSIIKDVALTNCTLKNSTGALNFLGTDNEQPSAQSSNAIVKNNVFVDVSGHFLTLNGFHNLTLERNTHFQGGNTMTLYGRSSQGFIYRDNVTIEKEYGVFGDGGTVGTGALEKYTPGYVFAGNVVATPYGTLPAGNEYPTTVQVSQDYRTPYAGKGCDIDALLAAQGGTSPTPTPTPEPTPVPVPEEYRIETLSKDTEAARTALYQKMYALKYAAWSELSGPKIKFRRFP